MKSAINRRICYSRGELNNYMENYKNLSNYMKKIKEHESIKKNEYEDKKGLIFNKRADVQPNRKKTSSALSHLLYKSKDSSDGNQSEISLSNSYSTVKLTKEQRELMKKKNFTPSEVSFDLIDEYSDNSFDKEQNCEKSSLCNDLKYLTKSNKSSEVFCKRKRSQCTNKNSTKPISRELKTIANRILSIRKKSLKMLHESTDCSSSDTNKKQKLQSLSKLSNSRSNSISNSK